MVTAILPVTEKPVVDADVLKGYFGPNEWRETTPRQLEVMIDFIHQVNTSHLLGPSYRIDSRAAKALKTSTVTLGRCFPSDWYASDTDDNYWVRIPQELLWEDNRVNTSGLTPTGNPPSGSFTEFRQSVHRFHQTASI